MPTPTHAEMIQSIKDYIECRQGWIDEMEAQLETSPSFSALFLKSWRNRIAQYQNEIAYAQTRLDHYEKEGE
jgi:hypothetical protein